jgi:hypothetical protein
VRVVDPESTPAETSESAPTATRPAPAPRSSRTRTASARAAEKDVLTRTAEIPPAADSPAPADAEQTEDSALAAAPTVRTSTRAARPDPLAETAQLARPDQLAETTQLARPGQLAETTQLPRAPEPPTDEAPAVAYTPPVIAPSPPAGFTPAAVTMPPASSYRVGDPRPSAEPMAENPRYAADPRGTDPRGADPRTTDPRGADPRGRSVTHEPTVATNIYRARRPAAAAGLIVPAVLFGLLLVRGLAISAFGPQFNLAGVIASCLALASLPLLVGGLYGLVTGAAYGAEQWGFRVWAKPPLAYLVVGLVLLVVAGIATG